MPNEENGNTQQTEQTSPLDQAPFTPELKAAVRGLMSNFRDCGIEKLTDLERDRLGAQFYEIMRIRREEGYRQCIEDSIEYLGALKESERKKGKSDA